MKKARTLAALYGGYAIFALSSVLGFIHLYRQEASAHYRIFTGAARALWSHTSPHGTTFGTGLGYWFYSPSCGMFFFGPFSVLPEKLGLFLYMGISWVTFVSGAVHFFRVAAPKEVMRVGLSPVLGLFFLLVSQQTLVALNASKLEMMMTGVLFFAAADLIRERSPLRSGFLMATILNWKFQPLPTIGLLGLSSLFLSRQRTFLGFTAGFTAFWSILPFLVLPRDFMLDVHQQWGGTLSLFVQSSYSNFDNVFSFLKTGLGWELTYSASKVMAVSIGAMLGGGLLGYLMLRKRSLGGGQGAIAQVWRESVLLSLGLGAGFTVAFSPLSQNNGTIVYAPVWFLLLFSCYFAVGIWRRIVIGATGVAFITTAFAYSDLVSRETKEFLRHLAVKPLVCFLVTALALTYAVSTGRSKKTM